MMFWNKLKELKLFRKARFIRDNKKKNMLYQPPFLG